MVSRSIQTLDELRIQGLVDEDPRGARHHRVREEPAERGHDLQQVVAVDAARGRRAGPGRHRGGVEGGRQARPQRAEAVHDDCPAVLVRRSAPRLGAGPYKFAPYTTDLLLWETPRVLHHPGHARTVLHPGVAEQLLLRELPCHRHLCSRESPPHTVALINSAS